MIRLPSGSPARAIFTRVAAHAHPPDPVTAIYLVAEDGLRMATRAGARAAGLAGRIGSIEVGKRADIVIHTLERPEMIPTTNMIRNLVYASRSKSVRTVIVDGRIVLEDGAFVAIDERAMLAAINEAAKGLLSRMGRTVEPNSVSRHP